MDNKSSYIKERVLQIAEYKGISKEKFIENLGQTYGNFKSKSKLTPVNSNFIEDLLSMYPEINPIWLITGKGNMIVNSDYSNVVSDNNIVAEPVLTTRKTKDFTYDQQRIPLFNLEATMGLVPVVNGNGLDEEKILDYISIPSMAICDGAIYATGDSMYPLLKAGDIVAYKKVEVNPDTIFFGEIYIVALYLDELTTMKTIKFVQKSDLGDDYVKLVSHNSHHAPKDYKLNQIAAMGLVRASIRLHN